MEPWSGGEQPTQLLGSGGSQLQAGGSRWVPRLSGSFIRPRGLSRLASSLGTPGHPGPFGPRWAVGWSPEAQPLPGGCPAA